MLRHLWTGVALALASLAIMHAVELGRAAIFVGHEYAISQRYALLSVQREKGYSVVFDTATGDVQYRALGAP